MEKNNLIFFNKLFNYLILCSIPRAAAPLGVLCGSMPLTALQKILEGDM
jgi:hypothetical protein